MVEVSEIKEEAVNHYVRMIKYAESREPDRKKSLQEMIDDIDEVWLSEHCLYCIFFRQCCRCPLEDHRGCCNGAWYDMHTSDTWGEFAEKAKEVLSYIKEHG